MSVLLKRSILALILMLLAAALAPAMTPTRKLAVIAGRLNLETAVPKTFGPWQVEPVTRSLVVNPQQVELLKQLYSQILTRTYVNANGARIMLSIAYGEDQRDGLQVHHPEVCYPSQGFRLLSNTEGVLSLPMGVLPVRRLETVLGDQRYEPVTYWTMVGDKALLSGVDKKLAELRYGLKGEIADGLLFRVSSINRDSAAAFALQDAFVTDLLAAVKPVDLPRLSGFR